MLVQNLAITYKCYSSIGNSLNLKEMMDRTLKTFVSETHAVYAQYAIEDKDKVLTTLSSFGKVEDFNPNDYSHYKEKIKLLIEEKRKIVILNLDYGLIFLITTNINAECSFFISMFESFMHKLNTSVQACLNVQKMEESNRLLIEHQEELQSAIKAKDDFLANMSHELKTPLNSINVISSVMKKNKDNKLDDKQVKNLEIINNCGNYLLTLIDDVLSVSKLAAGKIDVNYSQISLLDTVNEVYEMFLPQANEKKIKIYFDFDKKIKDIYSDSHKIKQVIKNLLSNALKFVEGGSIYLNVKDEDDYVTIIVKDEGIGIPKDKINSIFDRFKQADSSITRKYGGTGLGLTICKEIIDLLKGTIYVKSEVNIGTSFYVTIPKNLDKLSHMNTLDLGLQKDFKSENKILLNTNENHPKPKKDRLIIYNTNAIKFFELSISLKKDFEIIQIFNINELFKKIDDNISNIIVDIASIDKDELNKIISSYSHKLLIITDDSSLNISTDCEVKVICGQEINQLVNRIKGYNAK